MNPGAPAIIDPSFLRFGGSAGSIPLTSELDAAAAAEADVVVSAAAAVAASVCW